MTEEQWLSCTNPTLMLEFLRTSGRLSGRKSHLFAVACCRRIWHLMTDERSRRAVEVAERFTEGASSVEELFAAGRGLRTAASSAAEDAALRAAQNAVGVDVFSCSHYAAFAAASTFESRDFSVLRAARDAERAAHVALLRDLFGNPFRPLPSIDPAWLAWNNRTVRRLTQSAYETRSLPGGTLDDARLAVLADALEEAGCGDAELLAHLRGPGPHVLGCWCVDLLLGKS
jgi:hypothetical protein